jgi:hypothetical protein
MSLPPLQIAKRETSAAVVLDPNIEQMKLLAPNCFASPELPVPFNDPVREAQQREQRMNALWAVAAPRIHAARQAVDAARVVVAEKLSIWRSREAAMRAAAGRLGNLQFVEPVQGARADARSQLEIAKGYEAVARFHLDAAQEQLHDALQELELAVRS